MIDEAGVIERNGVPPRCIPDWLALVGDTADGIPGVPGFGAKTATALLNAHGSLEAIPEDPADWQAKIRGAAKLAATLNGMREEAALYKRLATLDHDVPLAESIDDLRWRGVPRDAFEALQQRLGPIDYPISSWR